MMLALLVLLAPGILGAPHPVTTEASIEQSGDGVQVSPLNDLPLMTEFTEGAFEGDMMLTIEQYAEVLGAINDQNGGRKNRKAKSNASTRWPQNIVPYVISSASYNDEYVIRPAMDHWEEHTCLRFEPWTSSLASQLGHNSRVSYIKGGGCWSYVGKVFNGEQQISIGHGCEYVGIVAHEIGHAIGFHHVQSRPDRDDFITVYFGNIQDGLGSNFNKYSWNDVNTREVEYDVGSVMHYGPYVFSRNGQPTIVANNPADSSSLGSRDGLSFADIKLANLIYECNADCEPRECRGGGYQGPNCDCICPPGVNQCDGDGPVGGSCDETLTDLQGEITSPYYPRNYDNQEECVFTIQGGPGTVVQLTFLEIDIEVHNDCDIDYVEVRVDGGDNVGEKFCGTDLPEVLTSVDNVMVVRFISDGSVTNLGFRASYQIVEAPTPTLPPCDQTLTDLAGEITSPNYPSNYNNGQECIYTIQGAPGTVVQLTFLEMDIEVHSDCGYDYVDVRVDGGDDAGEKFCGYSLPAVQTSVSNQMVVRFFSDSFVNGLGFRATYLIIDDSGESSISSSSYSSSYISSDYSSSSDQEFVGTCGGDFVGPRGTLASPNYPENYDNDLDCVYVIEVEANHHVALTLVDFALQDHRTCSRDVLEVDLGEGIKLPLKFCGTDYPDGPIMSVNNRMMLRFRSNRVVVNTGFAARYHIITDVDYSSSSDQEFVGTCGGDFAGPLGTLASPNYPENYDNDLDCVYVIEVEANHHVALTLVDFALQNHRACSRDVLEVDLGEGIELPLELCGTDYPDGLLVSVDNRMVLRFRTDRGVVNTGFAARYRAIDI